ncbi:MAG: hypothetical protein RIS51_814 [Actinomycetota bacterium]
MGGITTIVLRLFASLFLLFSIPVGAALADDADDTMVPPAVVEEDDSRPEPIDLNEIEITTLTPADKFAQATTPLVVAMGIGAITLIVVTLAGSKEKASKSGEESER